MVLLGGLDEATAQSIAVEESMATYGCNEQGIYL